jgi:hypothetical protein
MRILRRASQLFASTITIAKAANDHEVIMTFMVIRKMPVFAAFALVMVGPCKTIIYANFQDGAYGAHASPHKKTPHKKLRNRPLLPDFTRPIQ